VDLKRIGDFLSCREMGSVNAAEHVYAPAILSL
jgi:hypothetical protein